MLTSLWKDPAPGTSPVVTLITFGPARWEKTSPWAWSTRSSLSLTTDPGETISETEDKNCGDTATELRKNWTTCNYTTRHLACNL